jgi:hypothetical protein
MPGGNGTFVSQPSTLNPQPGPARRALRALADGVPPPDGTARWLTVGQAAILAEFEADLDAVAAGDFRSLLILGDPGAGKSQLLASLRQLGVERGFATAHFAQDPQSRVGFNRPDQIYRRLVDTLSLPAGGAASDPLRAVMEAWADASLPRLVGTPRSAAVAYRLSATGLLPRETQGIPLRTRLALVGFLLAIEQQNDDAQREFLNVMRGVGLTNTELIQVARGVGYEPGHVGWTPTRHDARYHFGQLRTLLFILRALGYPGMLVLCDEMIALIELGARSRDKAYRVLDALFFNEYQYQGLYAVFAYVPAFFSQLQADRDRLGAELVARWRELLGDRIRWVGPLTADEMIELFGRLARLHGVARGWAAWDRVEADGQRLVALCQRRRSSIRDLVRNSVALLEQRYAEQEAARILRDRT